jgi:hypothetical protein
MADASGPATRLARQGVWTAVITPWAVPVGWPASGRRQSLAPAMAGAGRRRGRRCDARWAGNRRGRPGRHQLKVSSPRCNRAAVHAPLRRRRNSPERRPGAERHRQRSIEAETRRIGAGGKARKDRLQHDEIGRGQRDPASHTCIAAPCGQNRPSCRFDSMAAGRVNLRQSMLRKSGNGFSREACSELLESITLSAFGRLRPNAA